MAPILIVGSNSWCTIAQADAYMDEIYDRSAWATLSNEQKSRLLISAFRWINQQTDFSIPATSSAAKVLQAQYEAAWFIYKFFEAYEKRRALSAGGVSNYRILDFSETLNGVEFPIFIKEMLIDFAVSIGGGFPVIHRDLSSNESE
jgi:hypothetical protein